MRSLRWLVVLGMLAVASGAAAEDAPLLTIAEAIRDSNGDTLPDRLRQPVHVRGVVTIGSDVVADDRLQVYLQDETGGLYLFAREPGQPVRAGDVVDVTGELLQYRGSPQLSRPQYKVVGQVTPPAPKPMTVAEAASWPSYGRLVTVRGQLRGWRQEGPNLSYELAADGGTIRFLLPPPVIEHFPHTAMTEGSELEVTGVVSIYSIVPPYRDGFRLIVGAPAWVRILSKPLPRWITRSILVVLLAAVLVPALFFTVRTLRRGARRRNQELAALKALSTVGAGDSDIGAFLDEAIGVMTKSELVDSAVVHLFEGQSLRLWRKWDVDDARARSIDEEVRERFETGLADRGPVAAGLAAKGRGRRLMSVPLQGRSSTVGVLTASISAGRNARVPGWLLAAANLVALGIESARMLEASEQREREFEQLAICDPLTGLYNRRFMEEYLRIHMAMARRQNAPVSFITIDVDEFKAINDRFGHEAGDQVLADLGELLRSCTRASDLAVRFGGEEFLVVMMDTSEEGAMTFAQRFQSALRGRSYPVEGVPADVRLTVSIGIAVYPDHAESVRRLLKVADESMYESKRQGRDRITIAAGVTRMIDA
ncbi:MAG: diguanylate cyclase [Thermoanaerobaculia bacterium]